MDELTYVESVKQERVSSKPPSCSSCPLYNDLQLYNLEPPRKCDVLILAPSPIPIVSWALDKANRNKSLAYIDTPFSEKSEAVVRSAVLKFKEKYEFLGNINFWYGVQCRCWKPSKEAMDKCSSFLSAYLDIAQPKVIVTLGAEAVKALGVTAKFQDIRGRLQDVSAFGKDFKVMSSFHPLKLTDRPGILAELELDISRAFEACLPPKPKIEMKELTKEYILPKTIEEVRSTVDHILSYTKNGRPTPLAVDIETNTLLPYTKDAKIITISFAWDEGKSTTLILNHKQASDEYLSKLPEVRKEVSRLLESDRPKIGHNFKFDYKFIVHKDGYKIENYFHDTLLMEHLLNEERSHYKLKGLVRDYFPDYSNYEEATEAVKDITDIFPKFKKADLPKALNKKYRLAKQEIWKNLSAFLLTVQYEACRSILIQPYLGFVKETTYEDLPIDDLCMYAAIDSDVTWRLAKRQIEKLKTDNGKKAKYILSLQSQIADAISPQKEDLEVELSKQKLLKDLMAEIILPFSTILSEVEYKGLRLDIPLANSWINEAKSAIPRLEKFIRNEIKDKVTLNSPADIARLVYSKLGLPIIKTTDKGAPSTDEETLSALYEQTQNPVVKAIIDYRGAKSCYEKLITYKNAARFDGFVHTDFNLFGTTTGRLSSSGGINLQNIPTKKLPFGKKLKCVFIPSDPDNMLIGNMDLGTAEVVILTGYAPDPKLVNAINGGMDTHCFTASQIYGIPYQTFYDNWRLNKAGQLLVDPNSGLNYELMRHYAKRVTFGIIYGAGEWKISSELGISKEDAKVLLDRFFELYPGVKTYSTNTINSALQNGYVDTFFGRKRRFPILIHNPRDKHSQNQAINFRIQSTSNEMLNKQIVELYPALKSELGGRILAQVHDALVLEFRKDKVEKVNDFFKHYITDRIAEQYKWLPVPMKIDIETGPNYGDLH